MPDPRNKASFDKADQYKGRIRAYLKIHSSYECPFTAERLAGIFQIHEVVIRQAVGKARDDGAPIASGSHGFFYANTPDELSETIRKQNQKLPHGYAQTYALINSKINNYTGTGTGLCCCPSG